jgi:hypothetical protein
MKLRIIHSTFELKENERGMIIPCSNIANIFLAVSKETNKLIETNKCPICGKKIYLESSGWMGHY